MSVNTSSFTVPADILVEALKKFKTVIPKPHRNYGRLDHIMLDQTPDHKLRLHAVADIALQMIVDVDESSGWSGVVVCYSGLMSAVSAFKSERIQMYLADSLLLRGETSGASLECPATYKADDYPELTATAETEPLIFPAADLLGGLKAIAPCVATGGSRYGTQHVYLGSRQRGGVELAATDGHRLAVHAFPGIGGHIPEATPPPKTPTPESIAEQQLLPALNSAAVAWLLRYAGRAGDIAIRFDKKHAEITGPGWMLQARLCDGNYPPYREILKNLPDMPGRLLVKRVDMLDVLKKAEKAAGESNWGITLAADKGGEALIASFKTGERVVFTATIPAASKKFPGFEANRNYLLDMVTALSAEVIECRFAANGENDFILSREGAITYILVPTGGIDTKKPDYLAALAGPDQEYPGRGGHALPAVRLAKRPPPFKAVVQHALINADYRCSLLEALGVLYPVA